MPTIEHSVPVVRTAEVRFSAVEQYVSVGGGWDLDYVQLDPGKLDSTTKIYDGRRVFIKHVTFNRRFHQRGEPPRDMVSFGVLDDRFTHKAYNESLVRGTVLRFNTPGGFDVVAEAGFSGYPVSFTENFLMEVADLVGVPVTPHDLVGESKIYRNSQREIASLICELNNFFLQIRHDSALRHSPKKIDESEFVIAARLLSIIAESGRCKLVKPDRSTRYRGLVRAVNFIREHEDQAISIKELSRSANISWRTLDRAFREHFDVTPKQYLKLHHLNQARHSLQQAHPQTKIADVATHWGFWHLGQFAFDYKKLFGELPSDTLRSRKN